MQFSSRYQPLFAKPYARDKVNSESFETLPEVEQEFWTKLDNVDIFVITGGRGSGKSLAVEVDAHVRGFEFGHHTYYTRYTNDSLETTVKADFDKVLELVPHECEFQNNKIKYTNGLIYFKGLKRGSKAQTAGGKGLSSFNVQVVEEAEEHPSFEEFDKMRLSLRRSDLANYSILLLNPTTSEHWIYQHFFEEKGVRAGTNAIIGNICYIHTSYLDVAKEHHTKENWKQYETGRKAYEYYNELTQEQKENCSTKIFNLFKWYKFVVLGGWKEKQEGVIFENWELGPFDESLPYIFGQDYGYDDPTTLIKVSINKKKKLLYLDEIFYLSGLDDDKIFELNMKNCGNSLIVGDSAAKTTIITLQRKKQEGKSLHIIPCVKKQGSVLTGIQKMQKYQIIVTPRSKNLIKELNNYVWLDKKSDVPIDDFNHLIDPTRYAVDYLDR
ncbi:MAG: phage terminase large subunit [Candidatus Diapherotrites archaeon]|nr:phage terminase large subunit [Candidatus Diapherotrites archaeon]